MIRIRKSAFSNKEEEPIQMILKLALAIIAQHFKHINWFLEGDKNICGNQTWTSQISLYFSFL